ncbi:MAG TPA: acyltransferase [Pyrinomonadaceae bacterium]|nr:acyltransferase [Pyrinomonadaceae bacterium]
MRYPTGRLQDRKSTETEDRRAFYHPELDVLRFLAFLAVFFHHALPRDASVYISGGLPPVLSEWLVTAKEAGAYGVDLFFVLSAYLITELLLREHASRGSFSISAFYMRRALRIWPLYFGVLALTVFIVPALLPADQFGSVYIVSFALFFGNWVCAANGLPFSVASPLWSISVEEQFYLAWPPLLRLVGINRIKQLAIVLLGVALSTRILLAAYNIEHPGVWCNTVARLDSIALGAILAIALAGRAPQMKTVVRLVLGGLAAVIFLLVARYLRQDGPTSVLTYLATATASVMLLVAMLRADAKFLLQRPFSWLVYLGRISYGLYIFHLLALALIPNVLIIKLGIPVNFESRLLLSFGLTVLLAAVSYRFLEQPFLRLKKRFSPMAAKEEREADERRVSAERSLAEPVSGYR